MGCDVVQEVVEWCSLGLQWCGVRRATGSGAEVWNRGYERTLSKTLTSSKNLLYNCEMDLPCGMKNGGVEILPVVPVEVTFRVVAASA
jgi:hypothetical protein